MKKIVLLLSLVCLLYSCNNKTAISELFDKEYSVLTAEERSLRSSIIRSTFPDVVKSIRKSVKLGLIDRYGLKDGTNIFDKIENILKSKKHSTKAIYNKLSGVGEKQLGMEISLEQVQLWRDYLNNVPKKNIPLKLETMKPIIDQKLFTPLQVKPNEK